MTATIRLPWPPTVNNHMVPIVVRGRSRFVPSSDTKVWRTRAAFEIIRQRVPRFGDARVSLTLTLHAPANFAYDVSNFVKEVEDAITRAKIWKDDCQVDRLVVDRGAVMPHDGHVVVEIRVIGE